MMAYRDMTFCRETTCKHFGKGEDKCWRSLTDEVLEDATTWWGSEEAPISMFTERPSCYEENK